MERDAMEIREKQSSTRWKELPEELLVEIFQKLDLHDKTSSVPFICRSWFNASLNPHCWVSLDLITPFFAPMALKNLLYGRGGLSEPTELDKFSRTLQVLLHATNRCPNVRILKLHSYFFFMCSFEEYRCYFMPSSLLEARNGLGNIFSKWVHLEELQLDGSWNNFRLGLDGSSLPVTRMDRGYVHYLLRFRDFLAPKIAMGIVSSLPNVRRLVFVDSFFTRKSLLIILRDCKELELLVFKGIVCFHVDEEICELASYINQFRTDEAQFTAYGDGLSQSHDAEKVIRL